MSSGIVRGRKVGKGGEKGVGGMGGEIEMIHDCEMACRAGGKGECGVCVKQRRSIECCRAGQCGAVQRSSVQSSAGQDRAVRCGQVRSGQVKSGQIRSDEVGMSGISGAVVSSSRHGR